MMCAKLLRHKPEAQQGRFYRASERVLRERSSTSTAARSTWVLRHQPLTLLVAVGDAGRHGAALHRRAQGLLPGAGHRRDPGHLRGAAGRLVRRDGRAAAGAGRGRSCRTRRSRACRRSSASTAPTRRSTAAASRSTSSRSTSATISASDVIRRLQPKLAEGRRHHALHAAGAGPDGRGPRQPHAVPVHPRGRRRRRSCATWVPQLRRQAADAARAARRRQRPAERGPAGARW